MTSGRNMNLGNRSCSVLNSCGHRAGLMEVWSDASALKQTGRGVDFACAAQHACVVNKLILILLAILLPPLAVYLKSQSGKQTILNVVLCIFFWVPGILHALYVVLK
jgi:uncharacterized membrane protein YqaE (UPF0057 family)